MLRALRFVALLTSALALTMTAAHVLELPVKMAYPPELYAIVNATLYRYFRPAGGVLEVAALLFTSIVAALVRTRRRVFRWNVAAAAFSALSLLSWWVLVEPVNRAVARFMETDPLMVPQAYAALRPRWEYGHAVGFVLGLLSLSALLTSVVLDTPREAGRAPVTVHASVTEVIRAPVERVRALYLNYSDWPNVFPRTIRGVRLLRDDGPTKRLEIDHVEGKVVNVISTISSDEVRLEEWKRRYDARFINHFEAVPEGTRYSLVADVTPKGLLRLLAPFGRVLVQRRMIRFVLEPLRHAAES